LAFRAYYHDLGGAVMPELQKLIVRDVPYSIGLVSRKAAPTVIVDHWKRV
jgi:hypothetical protein